MKVSRRENIPSPKNHVSRLQIKIRTAIHNHAYQFAIKEKLEAVSSPQTFRDRMVFLTRFIPIILREHEVEARLLTQEIDDEYINLLRTLSIACKTSSLYSFPQNPSLNFLERVIHFFVNCILCNDVEGDFRFHLMWVNWLGDLSRRSRKNLLSRIRNAIRRN